MTGEKWITEELARSLGFKIPDSYRPGDRLYLAVACAQSFPAPCWYHGPGWVCLSCAPQPPADPCAPGGSCVCPAGDADCAAPAPACSGYCTGCHKEHGEIEAGS